jgi:hypothetical protein
LLPEPALRPVKQEPLLPDVLGLPPKMRLAQPRVQAHSSRVQLELPLSQARQALLPPAVALLAVLASISPLPWLPQRLLLAPRDPRNASAPIRHARYRANSSASSFP